MKILLTNDDGIFAPGIRELWRQLVDFADVYVAAPAVEQSGRSQAITVHDPIRADRMEIEEGVTAWKIGGTPADCVKIALEDLLPERPDVVLSGINRGPNLGCDVFYSGTVGAALEGGMKGILSLALSLDTRENTGYIEAARFTADFLRQLEKNPPPPVAVFNINFPRCWRMGGEVAVTRLGRRDYANLCQMRLDPSGRPYYWLGGKVVDLDKGDGTDIGEAAKGKATITPLHLDLTDFSALRDLAKWWEGRDENEGDSV